MTWHNFSISDVQVGRWCGRMWWLSGEPKPFICGTLPDSPLLHTDCQRSLFLGVRKTWTADEFQDWVHPCAPGQPSLLSMKCYLGIFASWFTRVWCWGLFVLGKCLFGTPYPLEGLGQFCLWCVWAYDCSVFGAGVCVCVRVSVWGLMTVLSLVCVCVCVFHLSDWYSCCLL